MLWLQGAHIRWHPFLLCSIGVGIDLPCHVQTNKKVEPLDSQTARDGGTVQVHLHWFALTKCQCHCCRTIVITEASPVGGTMSSQIGQPTKIDATKLAAAELAATIATKRQGTAAAEHGTESLAKQRKLTGEQPTHRPQAQGTTHQCAPAAHPAKVSAQSTGPHPTEVPALVVEAQPQAAHRANVSHPIEAQPTGPHPTEAPTQLVEAQPMATHSAEASAQEVEAQPTTRPEGPTSTTVKGLQAELTKLGLDTTGLKATLQERLDGHNAPQPSPQGADQAEAYPVDQICGKRCFEGEVQYDVLWANHGKNARSWESLTNLQGAEGAIDDFENLVAKPPMSKPTALWSGNVRGKLRDVILDNFVCRYDGLHVGKQRAAAKGVEWSKVPPAPTGGIMVCALSAWYQIEIDTVSALVGNIKSKMMDIKPTHAVISVEANHDGSTVATSIRFVTPWFFKDKSAGHAVFEVAMQNNDPGSARVNLCRSLCGRHDYIGHLQRIDTSAEVDHMASEIYAIVRARVCAGMPAADTDAMARWRNTLASVNTNSSFSAPCFAEDLFGNRVYTQQASNGTDFMSGADICIKTKSSKGMQEEYARVLGFVELPGRPGVHVSARWWIQASSVPCAKHRQQLKVTQKAVSPVDCVSCRLCLL